MIYKYLFVIFLILSIGCKNADKRLSKPTQEDIEINPGKLPKEEIEKYNRLLTGYFDTMLLNRGFNGAILVAKDGNIIYEKYQGQAQLHGADSINNKTPFHIASVSKTFTGVAILKLVEEGKLSLTDSLEKIFPNFPYRGITIKALLNHRSGLPNYLYFIKPVAADTIGTIDNAKVVNQILKAPPPLSYPPDTKFSYSNTNYLLLAAIIEKVTNSAYADFLQKKLFAPLKMKSSFLFTLNDTARIKSYRPDGSNWSIDPFDCTYGDKNICGTVRDLLKWNEAVFNQKIISQQFLDSATKPYSLEHPSIHNYGLGFRLMILPNNKKVVYHYGRWHGNNAVFARLLDEKVAIIITGNKFTKSIYSAARYAYNLFGDYGGESLDAEDTYIDYLNNTTPNKKHKK